MSTTLVPILPSGHHWVTCDKYADPETSRYRHVVRRGGITTGCGATASAPDVWEPVGARSRKPYCQHCIRSVTGLMTGDRVRVTSGRYAGRVGTFLGGRDIVLDAHGRAGTRMVRAEAEFIGRP